MSQSEKPMVGWREWVALPQLGVKHIKAKIDTGARTSALHAWDLQYFERGGVRMVRFTIHPVQRSTKRAVTAEAPLLDHRHVRSSSGEADRRPVILTELELMGRRLPVEITLTNRDTMGFRMLIGRQALRGRYTVDPGRSFFAGRPRKKKSSRKRKAPGPSATRRVKPSVPKGSSSP